MGCSLERMVSLGRAGGVSRCSVVWNLSFPAIRLTIQAVRRSGRSTGGLPSSPRMRRKAALIEIRYHFHEINADEQLTSEDKKQIKDFYHHNFIAPEARKALEKYYPQ